MGNQKKSFDSGKRRIFFGRLAGFTLLLAVVGCIFFLFFTYADGEESLLRGDTGQPPALSAKNSGDPEVFRQQAEAGGPAVPGSGNAEGESATPGSTHSRLSGSPDEDFPEELDDLSYYAPVPLEFPSRGTPRKETFAGKQPATKGSAAKPLAKKSVSQANPRAATTATSSPSSRKNTPPPDVIQPRPRTSAPAPVAAPPLTHPKQGRPALRGTGGTVRPGSPRISPPELAGKSIQEVAKMLSALYSGMPAGRWGEHVAGVVRRLDDAVFSHTLWPDTGKEQNRPVPFVIALTFDACDGAKNRFDAGLIAFLREKKIPATLFVTSTWMRRYKQEMQDLASEPLFEIAAHGERHRPCSVDGKSAYGIKGTASMTELTREVLANARAIEEATGHWPGWFRSGTAHYDELAVRVIGTLGMRVAGYSIAGDQGATLPSAKVAERLMSAENGDIFLFHMNKPGSGTREGLKRALPALQERGVVFVRLSDTL